MMKKQLLSIVLFAVASIAVADDYKYMNVQTANQQAQGIALAEVQKITFTNTEAIVHTTNGELAFPLTDLERMSFSATPAAIDNLRESAEGLRLTKRGLEVSGAGTVCVYSPSGMLVMIAPLSHGQSLVSLDNLQSGTYIVRHGKQTIKLNKQK